MGRQQTATVKVNEVVNLVTEALRDALEATANLPAAHGIFNMTPNDHQGFDQRARVMVTIENGTWKLVK